MIYEIWQNDTSSTIFPEDHPQRAILIEPDARCIGTVEAASWEDAMTQYHQIMGWEPYVPME